jgi:DNA-directed RNA polymerase subunit D
MIKILNKNDEKLKLITDMSTSLANAIRRNVNEISILAIDELEISKNDSALYDEIIAHRVGLVPIKNENLKSIEECSCKGKGCGKCSVKFKLKATGPCTVYSTGLTPKSDIIYEIPITLLDKDQELEFVAIAKMGKGIEHAKFTPGLFYYKYSDDVDKEDVKEDEENFKKVLDGLKSEGKELTVYIESWGQIKAKEIFIKAIEALTKNLKDFSKLIK